MKEFLKLIRWQNLLIVILTMVLMRYAIIAPLLGKITVVPLTAPSTEVPMILQLPWFDFLLLVFATVCLTAGGYVINDYFDIKTDLINRGQVVVGTKIPRRRAMMLHNIFNLAGVISGFYISYRAGYLMLGTLFLVVSGLLYFYSASYKRQFLIGNFIVALLTAAVPMLVAVYEWPALYKFYKPYSVIMPDLKILFYWVGGFSVFAFLTTITREIIKDIEDFEGDIAYGRNTVPVVTGIRASKIISIILIVITIILLLIVWHSYLDDKITLLYITLAIILPLLVVIYQVVKSNEKHLLHKASSMLKFVMLAGILYSLVVKAILTWNLV